MNFVSDILSQISSYAVLLPIICGFIVFKNLKKLIRFFLFFLIYGFLTDIFCLYTNDDHISNAVFNFYTLIEAVFCMWFIMACSSSLKLKNTVKFFIAFLFLFWLVCHVKLNDWVNSFENLSAWFDTAYAIIIVSFSGYSILKISQEEPRLEKNSVFWFMVGIFFYFFCTFFFSSLIETDLLHKIWFLHNIINILTYFIYTKAFLVAGRAAEK